MDAVKRGTVEAQQGSGKSRHASTDDFTRLLDLHAGLLRPEMQDSNGEACIGSFHLPVLARCHEILLR